MKNKKSQLASLILVILTIINIALFAIMAPYGRIFKSMLKSRREYQYLSESAINFINISSDILVIGGPLIGIVATFLFKISLWKRVLLSLSLACLPVSLVLIKHFIFPEPDGYVQMRNDEYSRKVYIWNTDKGTIEKRWRSEKPYSYYRDRKERVIYVMEQDHE